jgi:hypothetical protein
LTEISNLATCINDTLRNQTSFRRLTYSCQDGEPLVPPSASLQPQSYTAPLLPRSPKISAFSEQSLKKPSIELRYIPPYQVKPWSKGVPTKFETNFITLGALHFTPSYIDLDADPIEMQVVKDVDALNICIAEALSQEHGVHLFSIGEIIKGWELGQAVGGRYNRETRGQGMELVTSCIRIGVVCVTYCVQIFFVDSVLGSRSNQ